VFLSVAEHVIAKIQAAPSTAFDTTVNGLTALKKAAIPPAVVRMMINPNSPVVSGTSYSVAPPAMSRDTDDPFALHSPGIYTLVDGADGQTHMVRLETARARGVKNSGMFVHALTQGIATQRPSK
jgi:hypothetical protein